MSKAAGRKLHRRRFLKEAAGIAAASVFFSFPDRALASQKTLKIAKWAHFLPEYDEWFEQDLARNWGVQHDTQVIVNHIPVERVHAVASGETAARKGHDVFIFPWPPAEFQQHALDHTEIYQALASQHGNIPQLAYKSTFNPQTKKHFALADFWIPSPFQYFEDCWGEIGMPLGPVHYGSLRSGGKKVREKMGIPCGLALTPTLEGNITLHSMLYAFRCMLLGSGPSAEVAINKTVFFTEALKYVKALNQEAGSPEELTWGSSGNVRAMLAQRASCTTNAISLLREAEKKNPEVAKKIGLSPPLLASAGVTAFPHVTNCSAVWKFAQNQAGAKQFVTDLISHSKTMYEKSRGCNFPMFPKAVPDLIVRLENDPYGGDPPYKYKELKDALHWTPNLGAPGFASPVWMEVFNSFVIPKMFISVAKGTLSAEDAGRAAEKEIQRISEKWGSAV